MRVMDSDYGSYVPSRFTVLYELLTWRETGYAERSCSLCILALLSRFFSTLGYSTLNLSTEWWPDSLLQTSTVEKRQRKVKRWFLFLSALFWKFPTFYFFFYHLLTTSDFEPWFTVFKVWDWKQITWQLAYKCHAVWNTKTPNHEDCFKEINVSWHRMH